MHNAIWYSNFDARVLLETLRLRLSYVRDPQNPVRLDDLSHLSPAELKDHHKTIHCPLSRDIYLQGVVCMNEGHGVEDCADRMLTRTMVSPTSSVPEYPWGVLRGAQGQREVWGAEGPPFVPNLSTVFLRSSPGRHLGPLFLALHRPPVARHAAVALPGNQGVAPDLFGDDRYRTGKIGRAVL